jgi:hypothetical protein
MTATPPDLRSNPWANYAAIGGLEWHMPAFIHERGADPRSTTCANLC